MTSICQRCALRLQHVAQRDARLNSIRAFSSTPTTQKSLPKFEQSSNPELNSLLETIRTQYLIPAYLKRYERRMLFSPKYKHYITGNSVTTHIGSEKVSLEWLGDVERPDFSSSIKRATKLIIEGDSVDWANLPSLLRGTHEGLQKTPHHSWTERVVRKAIEVGQMNVVMRLLHNSKETGVSLKQAGVRRYVMAGLREQGQQGDWEEEGLKLALKNAQSIAAMLETPEHGSGHLVRSNDPRTQPETISVFLELAAVYAYKYQDGKDTSGMIKNYAEKLLRSLEDREIKIELQDRTPQWPMLNAIPIWHGLGLALKIVGDGLEKAELAQRVVADYGALLSTCAGSLAAENPAEGTYNRQALTAYESCVRD